MPLTINITHSQIDGIVAFATGGQTNATILTKTYNIIDTCATANDSCKLDAGTVGKVREIFNNTLNDMVLFPAVGERFKDGTTLMAINAPYTIAGGNGITFRCFATGVYRFN